MHESDTVAIQRVARAVRVGKNRFDVSYPGWYFPEYGKDWGYLIDLANAGFRVLVDQAAERTPGQPTGFVIRRYGG